MPHAELKGLEVDSMEELMNLLNEFFAFNGNNEFDDNEFLPTSVWRILQMS